MRVSEFQVKLHGQQHLDKPQPCQMSFATLWFGQPRYQGPDHKSLRPTRYDPYYLRQYLQMMLNMIIIFACVPCQVCQLLSLPRQARQAVQQQSVLSSCVKFSFWQMLLRCGTTPGSQPESAAWFIASTLGSNTLTHCTV